MVAHCSQQYVEMMFLRHLFVSSFIHALTHFFNSLVKNHYNVNSDGRRALE